MNKLGKSALALLVTAGLFAPAQALAAPGGLPASEQCAKPVLEQPQRLSAVQRGGHMTPAAREAALARAAASSADLSAPADSSLWLDTCGQPFYQETKNFKVATATAPAAEGSTAAPYPLADTFNLSSKPGASKTLYLNFVGGTVSGTAWNTAYNVDPLTVEPYSLDSDPAFSSQELAQIQQAWLTVAEDYAPFDVNVTTAKPSASALYRDSYGDNTYGLQAYITQHSPIYADCNCGGIAYVGITQSASTATLHDYGPAWVFADALQSDGRLIGEAASHELGHNFGLSHDGKGTESYYGGAGMWSPIMGVGYYTPLSQWSKGEYTGATNTEDDLSIITKSASYTYDDYPSSVATAKNALPLDGTAVQGLISQSADVDAFTVTAEGSFTASAKSPSLRTDLDVRLKLVDAASGAVVAQADPAPTAYSATTAAGLDATLTVNLPSPARKYVLLVDGVGYGSPAVEGQYSDYASLGEYTLTASGTAGNTTPTPPPLSAASAALPAGQVGQPYNASFVQVTGGTAPYSYTSSGVPAGLAINASTGVLSGTPTTAGSATVTVLVTDATGATATTAQPISIAAAPVSYKPLTFSTGGALPRAHKRRAYKQAIAITGGKAGYSWKRSGALPRGLKLRLPAAGSTAKKAVLYGKPLVKGRFTFKLTAKDARGVATTRTFHIKVTR